MKNANTKNLSSLLSTGFSVNAKTKCRIEEKWQQKTARHTHTLRWALVAGSIILVTGIGVFLTHRPATINYMGPNGLYSETTVYSQSFGESGPRGLETNPNYIHFQ